jgi:hypothetical protein
MKQRTLVLIVAAIALLAGGLVGSVVQASASGPNVTYYACLNKGKLIHVGTTSPTCPSTATAISWNSQGPPGTPGTNGTNGAQGVQGPPGPAGAGLTNLESLNGIPCNTGTGQTQVSEGFGAVSVNCVALQWTLTEAPPVGPGVVDFQVAGLQGCGDGGACQHSIPVATPVTLLPVPNWSTNLLVYEVVGTFTGWSDPTCTGTVLCTFAMPNADTTVTADFASCVPNINSVQNAHQDGVPGNTREWFDCTPSGTTNAIEAYFAALTAGVLPGGSFTTCGADHVLRAVHSSDSSIYMWAYGGPDAGTFSWSGQCPTLAVNNGTWG